MLIAATAAQFIQSSTGRWHAGRVFVVWNRSPDLGGLLVWGRPTETDVDQIFSVVDGYHVHAPGCDVITDMSRIDSMEAATFAALTKGMRERQAVYDHAVGRHAIVRSGGPIGGLVEGFFPLIGAHHSWRVFTDAEKAFDWIAHPEGSSTRIQIEQIVDSARATPVLLRRLREFLQLNLVGTNLRAGAAALGLSDRSLQRQLQKLDTHFHDELIAARIESACRLLAETDWKIEAIALHVGFRSHSHFSSLFHKALGEAPADYRERVASLAQL